LVICADECEWYGEFDETFEAIDDGTIDAEAIQMPFDLKEGMVIKDYGSVEVQRIDLQHEIEELKKVDTDFEAELRLTEKPQYAFKIVPVSETIDKATTVESMTNTDDRIPVIIAGGTGADVQNLWDLEKPNNIQDIPDHEKYVFYSMDYPGFIEGSNPGVEGAAGLFGTGAPEEAYLQDYHALFEYVYETEGKAPLMVGFSMGTSIVTQVAEQVAQDDPSKVGGMLLFNPFESMHDVFLDRGFGLAHIGYPFLAVQDEWASSASMTDLVSTTGYGHEKIPTMIYSTMDDSLVPSQQHRDLFETVTGENVEKTAGVKVVDNDVIVQVEGEKHNELELVEFTEKSKSNKEYWNNWIDSVKARQAE